MTDENGEDIFKKFNISSPLEITQSRGDQDYHLLMFCASSLDYSILEKSTTEEYRYHISDKFRDEMSQFGDYALLINRHEFLSKVSIALESIPDDNYRYEKNVTYLDFHNHQKINEYFKNFEPYGVVVSEYF